jgi:hypothetical protein
MFVFLLQTMLVPACHLVGGHGGGGQGQWMGITKIAEGVPF